MCGDKLRTFASACLQQAGTQPTRADLIADVLVCADERGIRSHGVNRLALYCDEVRRRIVNADGNPSIAVQLPLAYTCLDSISLSSLYTSCSSRLMVVCRATFLQQCLWMEIMRRALLSPPSAQSLPLHAHAHMALDGSYPGAATTMALLGTGPSSLQTKACLASASPTHLPSSYPSMAQRVRWGQTRLRAPPPPRHVPWLMSPPLMMCSRDWMLQGDEHVEIDMATSTVPLGRIEVARRTETACKQGWGVDADGRPTTHPDDILQGSRSFSPPFSHSLSLPRLLRSPSRVQAVHCVRSGHQTAQDTRASASRCSSTSCVAWRQARALARSSAKA